jgi:hypothetical protein
VFSDAEQNTKMSMFSKESRVMRFPEFKAALSKLAEQRWPSADADRRYGLLTRKHIGGVPGEMVNAEEHVKERHLRTVMEKACDDLGKARVVARKSLSRSHAVKRKPTTSHASVSPPVTKRRSTDIDLVVDAEEEKEEEAWAAGSGESDMREGSLHNALVPGE